MPIPIKLLIATLQDPKFDILASTYLINGEWAIKETRAFLLNLAKLYNCCGEKYQIRADNITEDELDIIRHSVKMNLVLHFQSIFSHAGVSLARGMLAGIERFRVDFVPECFRAGVVGRHVIKFSKFYLYMAHDFHLRVFMENRAIIRKFRESTALEKKDIKDADDIEFFSAKTTRYDNVASEYKLED